MNRRGFLRRAAQGLFALPVVALLPTLGGRAEAPAMTANAPSAWTLAGSAGALSVTTSTAGLVTTRGFKINSTTQTWITYRGGTYELHEYAPDDYRRAIDAALDATRREHRA